MTTKEKLLQLFEANKGTYFSGESLAGTLRVSRAAVWKAVKTLRGEGYAIDAVTNKGYCLSVKTDILSPQGIEKYLDSRDLKIEVFPAVESTNALVREKAVCGEAEGYIAIANEQTAGRGRYGRAFYSPAGSGAYLSMLLRPVHYSASQAVKITTMAAVAMCEAIASVSQEEPKIKWVNDIYIRGKKVCGILTEGAFGMESGLLEYAVLGVGVNVYPPQNGFPRELEKIAGSVFDAPQDDMKNRLIAAFISRFMDYYRGAEQENCIERYRAYSLVLGKPITVLSADGAKNAVAEEIDEDCHLLVRYENGETGRLSCGEIQIRI